MQFNSDANGLDLYTEARYWAGIASSDTTSLPIATFTRGANLGLQRVVSLILRSDRKWQWDDSNNTDLPIATTNMVANQSDYALATTQLKILEVKIKDQGGNWVNIDKAQTEEIAERQNQYTTAGDPIYYGLRGMNIFLIPTPSYSSTGGLKIFFQRDAHPFTVSDTTAEPGFASQFHRLVALYPARDYCAIKSMNVRQAAIQDEITRMEAELIDYYTNRSAEDDARISFYREDYGTTTDYNTNPDAII